MLAESLDDIEGAFQDAVGGRAATLPFADICIPSVFDDSLAPDGHHIVSMFTQWVPHEWAAKPEGGELESYADRVHRARRRRRTRASPIRSCTGR